MSENRARGWCFTVNNYTKNDVKRLEQLKEYTYLCYSFEVGEKKETPHIQGYVYEENKVSFKKLCSIIPRAHFTKAKGSAQQNLKYISKSSEAYEFGTMPRQGLDGELVSVKKMLDEGSTIREVADKHFSAYCKYERAIKSYQSLVMDHRKKSPIVIYCYGPLGVGKSYYANRAFSDSVYPKDNTKWWNGYEQQEVVILDDYEVTPDMSFRFLLKLLDEYPLSVETKMGSFIPFNSKYIIFTADKPLDKMFKHLKNHEKYQLYRRITEVVQFTSRKTKIHSKINLTEYL